MQQTWVPYCGAAPLPAEALGRWNLDPLLLAVLAALGLFAATHRNLKQADRVRLGGATALAAFLYVSPFCALGSALFSARVVHHVLLVAALAPLLAGLPALGRAAARFSLPLLTALHVLIFWAWHAPPLYSAALSSDAVFWAMQVTLAASAALWWARLADSEAGAAVVALLATMVLMGVLGALLTFAHTAFYEPHWLTTQAWGLSPLEDQQIAGLLMWVPASAIYLLAALARLYRSLSSEAAPEPER